MSKQMVLLTEQCTETSCGRIRYGELTDEVNTHWHVKRGVAVAPGDAALDEIERLRDPQWTPRERAALDKFDELQLKLYAGDLQSCLRRRDSTITDLRAAVTQVLALCDQNDGGLQQAHLVQLVEYIRAAAGSPQNGEPQR